MYVVIAILAGLIVLAIVLSVKVVHQQQVGIVERIGKFHSTLGAGPHLVLPVVDQVVNRLDLREQVRPFPPQAVITEDNLMVNIDSVIYFQIVDPARAQYEAQNYHAAIEQLTMTTLRNIIGGMDLEAALTSREEINAKLRAVLDEATGKWGIKVNRVELRAIEPPPTIRDAMEKGARAEREKRAQVLLAEGQRQAQILSASGEKESAILRAQGDREAWVLRAQAERQAAMLRAEGEAQAVSTVFSAVHASEPDQAVLSYQYLQMLPRLANGNANKVWVIPSALNDALKALGQFTRSGQADDGDGRLDGGDSLSQQPKTATQRFTAPEHVDVLAEIARQEQQEAQGVDQAIQEALRLAEQESEAAMPLPGMSDRPTSASDTSTPDTFSQEAPAEDTSHVEAGPMGSDVQSVGGAASGSGADNGARTSNEPASDEGVQDRQASSRSSGER